MRCSFQAHPLGWHTHKVAALHGQAQNLFEGRGSLPLPGTGGAKAWHAHFFDVRAGQDPVAAADAESQ